MNKDLENQSATRPGSPNNLEQAFCRVCYESGESVLVSPCHCSGSLKHIHEDCLKIWITMKYKDIKEAKCEVCGYQYIMDIKQKRKFNPKKGSAENFGYCEVNYKNIFNKYYRYCCIIPVLIFILFVMTIVIIIVSLYKSDVKNSLAYTIVMICICGIPTMFGLIMLFFALYKILYVIEIEQWCIFEYKTDNSSAQVSPSLAVKINS
ncbi:hypothetical protein SteCoe_16376 [Stentor coeruleus]|uniref:RING-CH-type domain-containing protein n=1 Tax=Stentor coeruleus TaxID=5963 RepID=A0A1R2C1C1_9CILI|nr:hypothetical protein SteCoe_16376 [Stentor coeruleus]